MSLNDTPSSERLHIGFFGRRNVGKSSIVNAITNQKLSIVSDIKGTTTDPVYKAMELLPIGPVMIIDTAGIDDEGELGKLRMQKSIQVLNKTDVAVLIIDATIGKVKEDEDLIKVFKQKNINYIVVYNKSDLCNKLEKLNENEIYVSAKDNKNIFELKEKIAHLAGLEKKEKSILGNLIQPDDFILLVVPIDSAAPKGRLILPQQQTIRDILDKDAISIVARENNLKQILKNLGKKPKLVITDSQVFEKVSKDIPQDILLTSFSILFARYKGNLELAVKGVKQLKNLEDNDTILISEGCTHHRQCDDIGTVKLPRWIKEFTKKQINFEYTSGIEFPTNLVKYKMIIHCGACMINEREMKNRLDIAVNQNVSITNYGITIAYIKGILKRSLQPFNDIYNLL